MRFQVITKPAFHMSRQWGSDVTLYTDQEAQRIREIVSEEPRRLAYVQTKIAEETGKTASKQTLSRLLKKAGTCL